MLKSLQNYGSGSGDGSDRSGVGAGYIEDFTPLHYFMNFFEGLRKNTKSLPIKVICFEHKIIALSSHHNWSAYPTLYSEPFSGKCHTQIFTAGIQIRDLDMRICRICSGDTRTAEGDKDSEKHNAEAMPVEGVPMKMVIFTLYTPHSKLTPHIHQMIWYLHLKYTSHNYQNICVISNVTNLLQKYPFFWWMPYNSKS